VQIGAGPTPIPTQVAAGPAFYGPIQSYLVSAKPTFEDDFSVANMAWGGTSEGQAIYALVNGGVLTITDHATGGGTLDDQVRGITFPTNGLFDSGNFALKFDFVFSGGLDMTGVEFRSASAQEPGYKFIIWSDGTWKLDQINGAIHISDGIITPQSGTYTVLLITQDQNLAIFVNDHLLYEADNLVLSGTSNQIYAEGAHGSTGNFDNFKFWNLDGVQIGVGPTPLPTQAAAGPAFYGPIQSYLVSAKPTFEDDFSAH
jgi:hypothetical protein